MDQFLFIAHLQAFHSLSEGMERNLVAVLHTEIYQPHQVIHAEGQPENRLWFVAQGLARSYYFDHTGKEHTLAFYSSNDLIFSYEGFWKESADRYLEALEPTRLEALRYSDVAAMLEGSPEARLLRDSFVRDHLQAERIRTRMLTWPAEERYRQTRKARPDLFRRVSVRLIATYLNMTRENLSRLMARDL